MNVIVVGNVWGDGGWARIAGWSAFGASVRTSSFHFSLLIGVYGSDSCFAEFAVARGTLAGLKLKMVGTYPLTPEK